MKLKTTLFDAIFGDLSRYDISPCPTAKKPIEKAEVDETLDGKVLNGVAWKTTFSATGFESDRVHSSKPGTRVDSLTGWDVAFLNEYHKNAFTGNATWKEKMAMCLKNEWATVQDDGDYPSAESVVSAHTINGKTEKGYGLSNVKKYFHAFNDALRKEAEEIGSK